MSKPVNQQHVVQDPNPFAILENDENSENDDDKAQQVLPNHIENQGAEDMINAKQKYFEQNQEYQGEPYKVQGA